MSDPRWRGRIDVRDTVKRHPILSIIGVMAVAGVVAPLIPQPKAAPEPVAQVQKPRDPTQPVAWPNSFAGRFVGPSLKDADSAQYREVTYRKRMGFSVLCGEVNAKNSFGGYSGYRPFLVIGSLVSIEPASDSVKWARTYNKMCVDTDADDHPKGKDRPKAGSKTGLHRAAERQ